jgi:hypothetical protein
MGGLFADKAALDGGPGTDGLQVMGAPFTDPPTVKAFEH